MWSFANSAKLRQPVCYTEQGVNIRQLDIPEASEQATETTVETTEPNREKLGLIKKVRT